MAFFTENAFCLFKKVLNYAFFLKIKNIYAKGLFKWHKLRDFSDGEKYAFFVLAMPFFAPVSADLVLIS